MQNHHITEASIEAIIAESEERIQRLRAELEEAEHAVAFLRKLRGRSVEEAGDTLRFKAAPMSPRHAESTQHAVHAGHNGQTIAEQPSLGAVLLEIVQDAGRFIHRAEINDALERVGRATKSQTVSQALYTLGLQRRLVKLRYDHTSGSIHWGLPEYIASNGSGYRLAERRFAPTSAASRRYAETAQWIEVATK